MSPTNVDSGLYQVESTIKRDNVKTNDNQKISQDSKKVMVCLIFMSNAIILCLKI